MPGIGGLMWLAAGLAAPAAAAQPAPAPASISAGLAKEAVSACPGAPVPSTDAQWLELAERLAADGSQPQRPCPRRPQIALRIASAIAAAPSQASADAYRLLGRLRSGWPGVKRDDSLARADLRRGWLLDGMLLGELPFAAPEERRAYFTSAEAIAWLRDRVSRGAPDQARLRLADALLGRRAPGDVAEARSLLQDPRARNLPGARLMLAETVLDGPADPAEMAEAASVLLPAITSPDQGPGRRTLLLELGRRQLASAKLPAERWAAIRSLGAAAYAGEPERVAELLAAVTAANGGKPPANATAKRGAIAALRVDDYPSRALREGIAGDVLLRALVDPTGRVIFTQSMQAAPQILVDSARRHFALRPPHSLELATPPPTPYVWVDLPPVRYRIER